MDLGEHYRPVDEELSPGTYRVVGASDDVTLLRVSDGAGRRCHTGEIAVVAREVLEEGFEPAPDPDAGVQPGRWARSLTVGLYWDVRKWF